MQRLDAQADFAPFVALDVAPAVRNAALKKLFADPHFKVMDGLDIYIDDYSQPDPLPLALLRRSVGAQFLGVVEPESPESPAQPPVQPPVQPAPSASPDAQPAAPARVPPAASPAASVPLVPAPTPDPCAPSCAPETLPHENPDL